MVMNYYWPNFNPAAFIQEASERLVLLKIGRLYLSTEFCVLRALRRSLSALQVSWRDCILALTLTEADPDLW